MPLRWEDSHSDTTSEHHFRFRGMRVFLMHEMTVILLLILFVLHDCTILLCPQVRPTSRVSSQKHSFLESRNRLGIRSTVFSLLIQSESKAGSKLLYIILRSSGYSLVIVSFWFLFGFPFEFGFIWDFDINLMLLNL
ncbi:hypothetical protein L2E82_49232 [Cichorium intybus]|uniref:Uncharacterized protein n=1 Tax=Cichorium intybus TaxID=13427 RepID=A0ACB8Z073_CICIN|nr:hypothetical protein L2E82_49232 [Cichorium intybus]